MPDGLSEQQAIATEIPYKNIKVNTDAIDGFINAWSMATQLKLKRQEVEGRMAALAQKNSQLEFMNQFKEESFNRTIALKNAELGQKERQSAFMEQVRLAQLGIAEEGRQTARDALGFHIDDSNRKDQEKRDLMKSTDDAMAALGMLDQKDPNYQRNVLNTLSQFNMPVSTRNKVYGQAMAGRKNYYDTEHKAIDQEGAYLRRSLGSDLYQNPGKGDLSILDAPDKNFVQNYKLKHGGTAPRELEGQINPDTHKKYEFVVDKKTGQYVPDKFKSFRYTDPADTTGATKYKTLAIDTLNDYQKQKQAYRDRLNKLGEPPTVYHNEPTDYDIQTLKNNPGLKQKFEARFGEGSADPHLQNSSN